MAEVARRRRRKTDDRVEMYPEWYRPLMQSGVGELEQLRTLRLACCIREGSGVGGESVGALQRIMEQQRDIIQVLQGVVTALGSRSARGDVRAPANRLQESDGVVRDVQGDAPPTAEDVELVGSRLLEKMGPVARRHVGSAVRALVERMSRGVMPTREGIERLLVMDVQKRVDDEMSKVDLEEVVNRRAVLSEEEE